MKRAGTMLLIVLLVTFGVLAWAAFWLSLALTTLPG